MYTHLVKFLVDRHYKDSLTKNDELSIIHCERTIRFLHNGYICTEMKEPRYAGNVKFYLTNPKTFHVEYVYNINIDFYDDYYYKYEQREKIKRLIECKNNKTHQGH